MFRRSLLIAAPPPHHNSAVSPVVLATKPLFFTPSTLKSSERIDGLYSRSPAAKEATFLFSSTTRAGSKVTGGNKKIHAPAQTKLLDAVIDWSFLGSMPETVTRLTFSGGNLLSKTDNDADLEQNYQGIIDSVKKLAAAKKTTQIESLRFLEPGTAFSDDLLKEFLSAFPNLRIIHIEHSSTLTPKTFDIITSTGSVNKLRTIRLVRNSHISPNEKKMPKIIEAVTKFNEENALNNFELDPSSAAGKKLFKSLSALIDDSAAETIVKKCPELNQFAYDGVAPISKSLFAFSKMKDLKHLSLFCPFIQVTGTKPTSKDFPALQSLNMMSPLFPQQSYDVFAQMKKDRQAAHLEAVERGDVARSQGFLNALSIVGKKEYPAVAKRKNSNNKDASSAAEEAEEEIDEDDEIVAEDEKTNDETNTSEETTTTSTALDEETLQRIEFGDLVPPEVKKALVEAKFSDLEPFVENNSAFQKLHLINFEGEDGRAILTEWFDSRKSVIATTTGNKAEEKETSSSSTTEEFYKQLDEGIEGDDQKSSISVGGDKKKKSPLKRDPNHISQTMIDFQLISTSVNNPFILGVAQNLYHLRRLFMSSTNPTGPTIAVDDHFAGKLGQRLHKLEILRFRGAHGYLTSPYGLANFGKKSMPHLKLLDLGKNVKLIEGRPVPLFNRTINMKNVAVSEHKAKQLYSNHKIGGGGVHQRQNHHRSSSHSSSNVKKNRYFSSSNNKKENSKTFEEEN